MEDSFACNKEFEMISNTERFVYNGVLNVSTFRDNFLNNIPTAEKIFSDLSDLFVEKKLVSTSYGEKVISIADIDYKPGSYVAILFWIKDPNIIDNDYRNGAGDVHRAKRMPGYMPSASAHLVVSLNNNYDTEARYPCVIENVAWISRSLIMNHLQAMIAQHMTEKKEAPLPKKPKRKLIYQPKIEFGASSLNTLAATFSSGAALKGVKWQELEKKDGLVGSQAYVTQKRSEVFISVEGKPRGGFAAEIVSNIKNRIPKRSRKVSVVIEDSLGKTKAVSVASHQSDILASFFVPQELIGPFTAPMLNMCEDKVRSDVVAAMLILANA